MSWPTWIAIGAGGALGAVSRHALVLWTSPTLGEGFPVGHFAVNVLGSVSIGVLYAVLARHADLQLVRLFIITGFLGAFTTYSAFSLDALSLIERGQIAVASAYVIGTVVVCIAGCAAGALVGRFAFG